LIRRYGHAFAKQRNIHSRSSGKCEEQEHLVKLVPNGWKEKKELEASYEEINVENTESPAGTKIYRAIRDRIAINTKYNCGLF